MELMKGNTELRQKTREQETTIAELREKIADQRRKIDYLHRAKKDTEENINKIKVSAAFFVCTEIWFGSL